MTELLIETPLSETVIEVSGGPTLSTTVEEVEQTLVFEYPEAVIIDLESGPRGEPGAAIHVGPHPPSPATGVTGDLYIVTEGIVLVGQVYRKVGPAEWSDEGNVRGPAGGVNTVNGVPGPDVILDKTHIGLSNVDNTSDAAKPISTATQTALNAKANDNAVVKLAGSQTIDGVKTFTTAPAVPNDSFTISKIQGLQAALEASGADSTLVHLAGAETITGAKTFTVSPIVPAPTADTHAAHKKYVDDSVAALVDAAPGALDTLNELAAALGDDPNFATTVTSAIGTKENAISPGTTAQYWRGDKTWVNLNSVTVDLTTNQTIGGTKTFSVSPVVPDSSFAISKTTGLQAALDSKQPTIAAGTTAQYYRGDKTWATLDKSAVGLGNVNNVAQVDLTSAQTIGGIKTFSAQAIFSGGLASDGATNLRSVGIKPVGDHGYISFHSRDAAPSTRTAYVGVGSAASTQFNITNEMTNGNIALTTVGTGIITTNAALSVGGNLSVTGVISGNGSSITALNGTQITTGTVSDARLSTNVATLAGTQTFSGAKTFGAATTFTGAVVVPAPSADTHASTKKYVDDAIAILTNGSPALLNTLDELAAALGDDPNFATTVTNSIATKAPINNPTFTGTVGGITKAMVGLGNVDNTSDASKPVSTAQQTALNAKVNNTGNETIAGIKTFSSSPVVPDGSWTIAKTTGLQTAIDGKASAIHTHQLTDLPDAWVKRSVRAATTVNIALTGLQTIDGVTIAANDRVLVKNQTSTATNGIYEASNGAWTRTNDADAASKVAGSTVNVDQGSANAGKMFTTTFTTNNALGTSPMNWYEVLTSQNSYALSNHNHNGTYEPVVAAGTTSQYYRGDKSWQTLNKAAVGLSNVDNTSDLSKPVSTATQTALDGKVNNAGAETIAGVKTFSSAPVVPDSSFSMAKTTGLIAALDGKVNNTGNETIAGVKTFSSAPVVPDASFSFAKVNGLIAAIDSKQDVIAAGTTAQYYRGDKTWQALDKSAVGLGNVDNTSDASKPISTATQTALNLKAPLASPTFTGTVSGITKAMVGLGNVDNTSDANKPISTATQAALNAKADDNAVVKLTGDQTIAGIKTFGSIVVDGMALTRALTDNQLQLISTVNANLATLKFTGDANGWSIYANTSSATISGATTFTSNVTIAGGASISGSGSGLTNLSATALTGTINDARLSTNVALLTGSQTFTGTKTFSVAPVVPDSSFTIAKTTGLQSALDAKAPLASPTFTGTVSGITKAMVGLGNVDNTSDANKPVSTATQTALNLKADDSAVVKLSGAQTIAGVKTFSSAPVVPDASFAIAKVSGLQTALNAKAPLASPTFTGTVSGTFSGNGSALTSLNGSNISTGTLAQARLVQNITRIEHGSTAGTARPTGATYVEWVGSVQPTNMAAGDTWINTSANTLADSTFPSGTIWATAQASTTEPTGWYWCEGQEKPISSDTALYNALTNNGSTFPYGTNTNGNGGAGSTHFRLPNLKGKVIAHLDGTTEFPSVGYTFGTKSVTLTAAQSGVPLHNHGVNDPGHTHGLYGHTWNWGTNPGLSPVYSSGIAAAGLPPSNNLVTSQGVWAGTLGASTGITIQNNTAQNASQGHNNVQPTMSMRYMVKR